MKNMPGSTGRSDRSARGAGVDGSREDRKTVIARAAVAVMGREGSRGFTHRAIDRELCFPAGTTSAYYRRRVDLVLAVFRTVVAEDLAILEGHFDLVTGPDAIPDLEDVVHFLHGFILAVAARDTPADLARYECYLVARRDPELATILGAIVRRREECWTVVFAGLGAADPARSAAVFDMMLRGIFYRNSLLSTMVDPHIPDIAFVRGMIGLALSATQEARHDHRL